MLVSEMGKVAQVLLSMGPVSRLLVDSVLGGDLDSGMCVGDG